jgi:hypothetical protein
MAVMEPQAPYLVRLLPTLAEVVVELLAQARLALVAQAVAVTVLKLLAQRNLARLIRAAVEAVVVEILVVLAAPAAAVLSSSNT